MNPSVEAPAAGEAVIENLNFPSGVWRAVRACDFKQHCLYFFPDPQGQGSFLLGFFNINSFLSLLIRKINYKEPSLQPQFLQGAHRFLVARGTRAGGY
ncbi:Uncharacterised protein [Chlamydia trachomatis]|nr:Uncharacterised protein [Chlamydia trachomatis]